jgi:hypothetical protein
LTAKRIVLLEAGELNMSDALKTVFIWVCASTSGEKKTIVKTMIANANPTKTRLPIAAIVPSPVIFTDVEL